MLFLPIFISLFTILFALFLARAVQKAPSGSGKQIEISLAIREGALAYLKRQYFIVSLVAIFLFFIIWIAMNLTAALGFFIGASFSALAGFIGMMVSTQANVKVVESAKTGLRGALDLAFRGGSVTGLLVVGLSLLAVSGFYFLTQDLKALVALGFGGSLISVFARLGGGIYTKAADVGADLVGKLEKGIPEDDPRNPAVIADQVGDNVGDVAGMAADLFETYAITLIAVIILGSLIFPANPQAVFLPLFLASIAALASLISIFFVKLGNNENIMQALSKGLVASAVLSANKFSLSVKSPSFFKRASSFSCNCPARVLKGFEGILTVKPT